MRKEGCLNVIWVLNVYEYCDILCHEEGVNLLQLLLWQNQTVDLLLPTLAWNGNTTNQHRLPLFLLFGLRETVFWDSEVNILKQKQLLRMSYFFTLTKEDTGKVAKSEEALAPRWCETTCSATSPWNIICKYLCLVLVIMHCLKQKFCFWSPYLQFVQSIAEVLQPSRLFQQLSAGINWRTIETASRKRSQMMSQVQVKTNSVFSGL